MTAAVALAAAAAGALASFLIARRPPRALLRGPHLRINYRGHEVAGTLGVVLVVPLGIGVLGASILAGTGAGGGIGPPLTVGAAAGCLGLLGLLDDVLGSRREGGFAGHLRALAQGRVTTGFLKAAGGGVVGLGAAYLLGLRGWWVPAGGATVALTANLANLLDLRPGRTAKVWLLGWAALVAVGLPAGVLVATAGLAGGLAGLLPADLGERGMLGDGGANLLGAALGAAAVATLGGVTLLVLLGCLAALTAASEVVSFTRAIERVGPLRALDRLGRHR